MNQEILDEVLESCTPRQKQVAESLIQGTRVVEIGEALGISRCRVYQIKQQLAARLTKAESDHRFRELVTRVLGEAASRTKDYFPILRKLSA